MSEFVPFPKIARYSRNCIVTEKIDGTNASIYIDDTGAEMKVGSRNQWIGVDGDNFGFASWCERNKIELLKLGPGTHFGEWWGSGIQRGYGLRNGEKRFSLFNTSRWSDPLIRPPCCSVVPVLWAGPFDRLAFELNTILANLELHGSVAAPGFMRPEGIIVFHEHGRVFFKKTFEKDDEGKSR